MTCAVAAFTTRGAALGRRLADALGGTLHVPARVAEKLGEPGFETLADWTAVRWESADALIFVGAAGIAVRAIAPHVKDKFSDPAVVSVDEGGAFALPLLSGHVGGANELAQRVAALTGGQAAISTATDVNGRFAVDLWAARHGLAITDRSLAKAISAALLAGERVGFRSNFPWTGELPEGVTEGSAELGFTVTARTGELPFVRTLRLVPKCLTVGVGCRRGTPEEAVAAAVDGALERSGYDRAAVARMATIDLKADEDGLLAFCKDRGWPLATYTAEELNAVEGDFPPSDFVRSVTGVDNVCQRSAALGGGRIVLPKTAQGGVTVSISCNIPILSFE